MHAKTCTDSLVSVGCRLERMSITNGPARASFGQASIEWTTEKEEEIEGHPWQMHKLGTMSACGARQKTREGKLRRPSGLTWWIQGPDQSLQAREGSALGQGSAIGSGGSESWLSNRGDKHWPTWRRLKKFLRGRSQAAAATEAPPLGHCQEGASTFFHTIAGGPVEGPGAGPFFFIVGQWLLVHRPPTHHLPPPPPPPPPPPALDSHTNLPSFSLLPPPFSFALLFPFASPTSPRAHRRPPASSARNSSLPPSLRASAAQVSTRPCDTRSLPGGPPPDNPLSSLSLSLSRSPACPSCPS